MLVTLSIRAEAALDFGDKMPKKLRQDRHAATGDAACNFGVAGKNVKMKYDSVGNRLPTSKTPVVQFHS